MKDRLHTYTQKWTTRKINKMSSATDNISINLLASVKTRKMQYFVYVIVRQLPEK